MYRSKDISWKLIFNDTYAVGCRFNELDGDLIRQDFEIIRVVIAVVSSLLNIRYKNKAPLFQKSWHCRYQNI